MRENDLISQTINEIEYCKKRGNPELVLRGRDLVTIPTSLWELESLEILDLSHNRLSELPPEIKQLHNLKELNLANNQFDEFPSAITQLEYLRALDIENNGLQILPGSICRLRNLKELYLYENQLVTLPVEIGDLVELEVLGLSGNKLALLPSQIGRLMKLRRLHLFGNQLSDLPPEIGNLKNLVRLDLGSNKLRKLPSTIVRLQVNLSLDESLDQGILLTNNPIEVPPLEIISKGREAIISYFNSLKENERALNELKILFVGQGSVGKTSVIRRIINNDFDPGENKTEGIAVAHWQVDSQSEIENSRLKTQLNIWDFGGQEIMHATHQFFLTKRSLYLLVLDSRLTQEENRVEYWLKIIQSFGGESPVLIVGNKIDQHPLDIDRTGLQKKYPNIVGILETSAATGAGIEELKAAISEQVNHLPHVRDLLPETWFTIKTKLEELGKLSNFITHDKYLDLCAENEVSDEISQRTLIGFLHDLGVVLHFQDDPRLEALGILNPQWVTNGVYKILNSHALFQNKGVLTVSMLDEIINLPEYPRGKRLFIVDMMKKFELGYDIEPDKSFLVPDLLPKDQPDLYFNGIPAFEYAYPVLPSSIITRFIVRMNQHIYDGCVWRTGVLLQIGDNTALVKADNEDRKITISIDGLEHTRRDALSAIRYQLDEIHASIKGLNPEKFVPIPEAESQRYEFLLQLEHDGVKILPVPGKSGSKPIMVDISQLLSGIETETQPREGVTNVTTIYNVNTGGGDFTGRDKSIKAENGGIAIGGDLSGSLISGNYNKINSAEITPELQETLLQLGKAVNTMLQKLPAEQATKVAEDFGKLTDEAVKPKPTRKLYSVSVEGLIKAAENVEKVGEPVINLSRKVLTIMTAGIIE